MGKIKYFILVFFIYWGPGSVFGGVNRYVIYLKDKAGTAYDITRPEEFLSFRAVDRRMRQNIPVTEEDLPVSEVYLNDLRKENISLFFTTKWMNAVLAEFDDSRLNDITALPFVTRVEFVAPGPKLGYRMAEDISNISTQSLDGNGRVREEEAKFEQQAALTDFQNKMMSVDVMHEKGYRGEKMLVGIFDSGFSNVNTSSYFSHLFSDQKVAGSRDFIRNSGNVFQYDTHGTKALSCISGYNAGEYEGTAYDASVVLCVTEDVSSEYRIEEYNWLFAAEYADSIGVDVINSSVGYSYFDDETMDYTYEDLNGKTAIVTLAAKKAASRGMIVVSSQGNEGNNFWKYLNAPADADSILSIGAVTQDLDRAVFSSFGPTSDGRVKPDLSTLGVSVRVVSNDAVIGSSGTSFSSPLVAGLVTGFWEAFPQLTNMEVIEYLKITASNASSPDTLIGWGIPDFLRAYNKVKWNEGDIDSKFIVFPNPTGDSRQIYIYSENYLQEGLSDIRFYDLKGNLLSSSKVELHKGSMPVEVDISFLVPGTYILSFESGDVLKKTKLVVL